MWHWGYDAWWMGVMMVAFWAGIVGLVVWAIRTPASSSEPPRSALDVLEVRYARGEIDDEEFHRRRARLTDARA